MKGTKWLPQAINEDEFRKGYLNIVPAPVGSGKTTWAIQSLLHRVSQPYKMLYLIDTRIGCEQIWKNQENATKIYFMWEGQVEFGNKWWIGDGEPPEKIVVMTYAKFGALLNKNPRLLTKFELIICDEIHQLPKFAQFKSDHESKFNYHQIAKTSIERIVTENLAMVIGLSATPQRALQQMNCSCLEIAVDPDVRQLETKKVIPYYDIYSVLKQVEKGRKGLVYISRISKMLEFQSAAIQLGIRAVSIWSEANEEHPMSQEQREARNHIITCQELPPQYDLVIINASSETGINIYGNVDYIIIHSRDPDTQTQVRGRYRKDLEVAYVLDDGGQITVPEEFMDCPLFSEQKNELCACVNFRDAKGQLKKWNTIKAKLVEQGYKLTEKRVDNKRCTIISE